MAAQNIFQNRMVNAGKKFSDVAFQNPGLSGIIMRNFSRIKSKAVYSQMRALGKPTGAGVVNEFLIKIWIQNSVDGVVDKPVAHAGLMNIARLGVIYLERNIMAVPISFVRQLLIEREYIIR